MTDLMEAVTSLAKRRGIAFQSSEIYGGLRSSWDYGPLGVELRRNIREAWWRSMVQLRDDVVHRLKEDGYDDVEVRVSLSPAWSSDWISERGRRALEQHGMTAPGPAPHHDGPVPISLTPTRRSLSCPRCGSAEVELTSEFGPTACTALYRCTSCLEPFEHVKEI